MTTPSERIWAELEHPPSGSGVEAHLSDRPRRRQTLMAVAERVRQGAELRAAVADFMDDLRWARDADDVLQRIEDEPAHVGRRVDAFLGALAEHVAVHADVPVPDWCLAPVRFLDHFWWPTRFLDLRARTIVESPAAFRRRGIYIGATTLERV